MTKHTYITTTDEPICDFCSRPDVRYRYPCVASFTMAAVNDKGEAVGDINTAYGDWAACAKCSEVIEKGRDPKTLAEHVVGLADPVPAFLRESVTQALATMYSGVLPNLGERHTDISGNSQPTVRVVEELDE